MICRRVRQCDSLAHERGGGRAEEEFGRGDLAAGARDYALARRRGGERDEDIGRVFGEALFECPADALADVPELLKALCPPEELPEIVRALDELERVKAEPPAAEKENTDET